MAITATNSGNTPRELIPTGNYVARCYKMIHIGTVEEVILGEKKIINKVRIGWELPTEQRVFNEEKGLQPLVIDKEFTLSLHEKSALRGVLKSWRGKDFTDEEAKAFDITKLIGIPCMINIIHKPSKKDPSRHFEEIAGITAVPKGFDTPAQINPTFVLDYDNFDKDKFETLPDFIKQKMQTSVEYLSLQNPSHREIPNTQIPDDEGSDLPF